MDKVYSKHEIQGCWWLKELTDIFYFKALNLITNQEEYYIFSWTRNCDLSKIPDNPVRRYDVEIDLVKYYFLVFPVGDEWIVKPENSYEIEKISQEKNILFIGDTLNVVE